MLVAVEQERSASVCNNVCACGYATSENKTTFETRCEANENSPVHQCRNVDDCRMHTCRPRGTSVDGVSSHSGDYDPRYGRRTSTEIRYVKTLTIVVLLGCSSNGDIDASENPMRAIDVERLVFDIFDGDSGDRLLIIELPAPAEARNVSQT